MLDRAWLRRLVVVGVVLAAGVAVPVVGERQALSELSARGLTWTGVHRSAQAWGVDGVQGPGLSVEVLRVPLGWPVEVVLDGVRVDVLAQRDAAAGGAGSPGGASSVDLALRDVTLLAGAVVIGEGLTGSRRNGRLALGGAATEIQLADGLLRVSAARESPFSELAGQLDVQAELAPDGTLKATVIGRELVLRHPLLAARGLPLGEVRVELSRVDEEVLGPLYVGDLSLSLQAVCDPACTISLTLPETPAEQALAPLAPLVPELRRARRIDGAIRAGVTVAQQDEGWTVIDADLSVEGLAVDGAVQDPDLLRFGTFAYRVRDADGDALVRQSGEGTDDWVPLHRVSPWVIEAILASEDAAFRRHRGYDPEQLQEALAADLAAGAVVRGGSTLSQQLAKNLFLTPERTLVRKVRELLLAVELDRVLGKSRMLELYVNVVEWGPEIWGLRQASDRYFLKQPARLQPHEAAFLAAILPAPRTFYEDWYLTGLAARYKVGSVLTNMADLGAMSHRQAARWTREPLRFVPPPRATQGP